ncbi:MAG: hypothetical protein H6R10_3528 [Rhodocyclaceae bacterium]|nr:hypothetical protein [Rhodocyclaceae bacterium]
MELVNIDRLDELEKILEDGNVSAAAESRTAVVADIPYFGRRCTMRVEHAGGFGAFAAPPSGEC